MQILKQIFTCKLYNIVETYNQGGDPELKQQQTSERTENKSLNRS